MEAKRIGKKITDTKCESIIDRLSSTREGDLTLKRVREDGNQVSKKENSHESPKKYERQSTEHVSRKEEDENHKRSTIERRTKQTREEVKKDLHRRARSHEREWARDLDDVYRKRDYKEDERGRRRSRERESHGHIIKSRSQSQGTENRKKKSEYDYEHERSRPKNPKSERDRQRSLERESKIRRGKYEGSGNNAKDYTKIYADYDNDKLRRSIDKLRRRQEKRTETKPSDRRRSQSTKRRPEPIRRKLRWSEDASRHYHSDSELEVGYNRNNCDSGIETHGFGTTDSEDKGRLTRRNSEFMKQYKDHKESVSKNRKSKKDSDTGKYISREKHEAVVNQNQFRGKLISLLFYRVKELTKENEDYRQENRNLQIKLKKEETTTEPRNEKLLTSPYHRAPFRNEVKTILDEVQNKYQSHLKDHEQRMRRVQEKAEVDINQLMGNIIGKYAQLLEVRERQEVVNNIVRRPQTVIVNSVTNSNTEPDVTQIIKEPIKSEPKIVTGARNSKYQFYFTEDELKLSATKYDDKRVEKLDTELITTNHVKKEPLFQKQTTGFASDWRKRLLQPWRWSNTNTTNEEDNKNESNETTARNPT